MYIYCKMLTTISLVNIHLLIYLQNFFLVIRTFRFYSLSNFQIYHTVVSTIVIMLCLTFPVLICLMTAILYLLTTFIQFPRLHPPTTSISSSGVAPPRLQEPRRRARSISEDAVTRTTNTHPNLAGCFLNSLHLCSLTSSSTLYEASPLCI